jgi:hypothetical protein
MIDGNLLYDRYNREHHQYEECAEKLHLADEAEHKTKHWSLGLLPLEKAFVHASIALVLIVLYGLFRFVF